MAGITPQQTWDAKYRSGPTPWDTRTTPPEVVAFWESDCLIKPGEQDHVLALDLGCGAGTNAAYLAALGIRSVGCEVSGVALATAYTRHVQALHAGRLNFVQADITALPILEAQADYILDIGCLHGLPLGQRSAYAEGVIANLRSGGYYHLYAFDRLPHADDMRGLLVGELETLFAPRLTIVEAVQARPDMRPCHWYLLQKPNC